MSFHLSRNIILKHHFIAIQDRYESLDRCMTKAEEGRGKREEGRGKKEEGRRKKEEGQKRKEKM